MTQRIAALIPAAGIGCLMAIVVLLSGQGCRRNGTALLPQTPTGISYDKDIEAAVESGRAPRVVEEAFAPHFESLSKPVAITGRDGDELTWQVFVGTNRGIFEHGGEPHAENSVLDFPSLASCELKLPDHRRGQEFSDTSSEASNDRASIVNVSRRQLNESEFLSGLNDQVQRSRRNDLLLFVHGFNVTFDAAVIRTAQIANDMPFNGAVCAYCWPSQGGASRTAYHGDETINQQSVPPFQMFLKMLRASVPHDTRIHIVVHSMGNRIVMESLALFPEGTGAKPISNLALCAPDVGSRDFQRWASKVVSQCEYVTLYANAGDVALKASQILHVESRAGDAAVPVITDGIETIDCSDVELSFLGHSYYGSNPNVLTDLFERICEGKSAAERSHLAERTHNGDRYWVFNRPANRIEADWQFAEEESENTTSSERASAKPQSVPLAADEISTPH
jgi:esterase/lipase superfamily enzyme